MSIKGQTQAKVVNLSQPRPLIFVNELATVGRHSSMAFRAEIAPDPIPPA
jgi:hypothetical protein